MAIMLTRRKTAEIPEGWHPATITNVKLEENVQVPWGTADRLHIRLRLDHEERQLVQRFIAHLSETSELGRFLGGLLGELPDEFDAASLVGIRCRIRVEHRTSKSGSTWTHVVEAEALEEITWEEDDVGELFEDDVSGEEEAGNDHAEETGDDSETEDETIRDD